MQYHLTTEAPNVSVSVLNGGEMTLKLIKTQNDWSIVG